MAIIGAEDVRVSIVACGLATFEIGEIELFTACELAIIGRKDMGVSFVALVLAAFEVGVLSLVFGMICLEGLVVLITLGGEGEVNVEFVLKLREGVAVEGSIGIMGLAVLGLRFGFFARGGKFKIQLISLV